MHRKRVRFEAVYDHLVPSRIARRTRWRSRARELGIRFVQLLFWDRLRDYNRRRW